MEDLAFRSNHIIKNEIEIVQDQMARNRIDLIFGRRPSSILIGFRFNRSDVHRTHAHFIVIAVGTVPTRPANIPFEIIRSSIPTASSR